MKLYYVPGTCALATHIALQESGLKYDAIKINPKTKLTPDGTNYLTINPKGYVPALDIDSGKILTEGAVLLQFISDQKPDKVYLPKAGTFDRYQALEWLNFIATEIHKGFNPMWHDISDEAKAVFKDRLFKRFDYLENHFDKNNYVLGKEYSACDMYLFTVMRWTQNLKIDMAKWPKIMGFMEKVQNRPAVQTALKDEGLL